MQLQARRYELSENWSAYLAYRPLPPDCSETELAEFFKREEETYCAMCPAEPEKIALRNPARREFTPGGPEQAEMNGSHPLLDRLQRLRLQRSRV